jgi:voltage-gated potassium channel
MPRLLERATERRKERAATRTSRRQPFRSRVGRLRASHSYRSVLFLVLGAFVFASLASDATWTTSVLLLLQAATLGVAMWTSGLAHADSKLMLALLAAAIVIAIAALVSGGNGYLAAAGLASAVLVVATIVSIAIGVVDQEEVNAQSITGAVCIYLLFGIFFMFLYSAVALLDSSPFFAQGTDGTRSLRLYFSYVTLATLGYGDYTPAGDLGHTMSIVEALFGQLYLVTVLALLVSRLQGRRQHD